MTAPHSLKKQIFLRPSSLGWRQYTFYASGGLIDVVRRGDGAPTHRPGLCRQENRLRSDIIGPGVLVVLLMACGVAAGAQTPLLADAQGWRGPGWYITNTATAAHATVLFEGPHELQGRCVDVYDRLYSPIGICRFVGAKPVEPAG
jgi:hypothetical protein